MGIRVTNAVLALGVSVLFARLLGPTEYGKYAILLSFATILAIPFKAGLPRTMTKEIAAARSIKDFGGIRPIIRLGAITFGALIPLVGLIALGLWLIGYEVAGMAAGVLIAAILAPILSADSNRMAVMRGLGSAIKSQVPDMLIRPIGTMVIVVSLMLTIGTASAVTGIIAYSAATFFGFLVGALMVGSELRKIPEVPITSELNKRNFFTTIATMSLLGASASITGNIDILLLDHYTTGTDDAGYYKVALAGLAVVVLGGNAVSAVAFTRLAEVVPTGHVDKIALHSDQALKWSILFTGSMTIVAFLVGRPVIEVLYGTEYSGSWSILVILAAGFTVAFLFGQGPDIASLGGAQIAAASCVLIGIGTTVLIASIAVESMGAVGIALGSMVGTITRFALIAIVVRMRLGVDITVIGLVSRAIRRRSN